MQLSIIIVNWNGHELLDRCLRSIEAFPPKSPYEIIIVDNASTDGSREWLKEKNVEAGKNIKVILNNENVGFGCANNQAMSISDADLFFLLNSDAELTAHSVDTLIDAITADSRIGAVGPKLLRENGSIEPSVWRNPPTIWEVLLTGLRIYKIIPRRLRGELLLGQFWPHAERKRVRFINGAAMMIRYEVFDQLGGFDEDFFMYGEDMEYSLRIWRAGWNLLFVPEAQVIHKHSQSSVRKWGQGEKTKVQLRGYLKFYKKSLGKVRLLSLLSAMIIVNRIEMVRRKVWKIDVGILPLRLKLYEEALWEAVFRSLSRQR